MKTQWPYLSTLAIDWVVDGQCQTGHINPWLCQKKKSPKERNQVIKRRVTIKDANRGIFLGMPLLGTLDTTL